MAEKEEFEIIVPVLLGLEAFTAREIKRLGYSDVIVEDGRVSFKGDKAAICRANMFIRTGERVLIKAGEFKALTFEELFEGTQNIEWERWIGKGDAFPVKGYSLKSKLASVRDCQAIIKKAAALRLSKAYGIDWLPEDCCKYQIQFSILKDKVTLMIDTSGDGLHKRGYRQKSNLAPLRETIAAAMVMMSYWKFEYPLLDPFCGSGTIPIEAAMFKKNIAPGLNRRFAAHGFSWIEDNIWRLAADEAKSAEKNIPLNIYASDIDKETVDLARENARIAGVSEHIEFECKDALKAYIDTPNGTIMCNPPYGERLGEIKECEQLYRDMGKAFSKFDNWAYYILAANEGFERLFGTKADKRRKVYNGMIRCNIYQYFNKRK